MQHIGLLAWVVLVAGALVIGFVKMAIRGSVSLTGRPAGPNLRSCWEPANLSSASTPASTQVTIDRGDGTIRGVHRKLQPTYAERYIWAQRDGSTMSAFDTAAGRVGGLACWDHTMDLCGSRIGLRRLTYGSAPDIGVANTMEARVQ